MKTSTLNWLLAGALVASLQWNLRQAWGGDVPLEDATELDTLAPIEDALAEPAAAPAASCSLQLEPLGLSDEQRARLTTLCSSECARADEDEVEAERKLAELQRALAAEPLDEPELRRLVRAISALRERSLTTCVDSVLEVRSILDEGQLQELLSECCQAAPGQPAKPVKADGAPDGETGER